jgi:exosortase E/protease (VPEID-CTERM system)
MFALNALRIAALMLIGYAGFPDVASFGFHSQAGWIAFNVVACGLAFFSRRSAWLNREASQDAAPIATENPTAVYLMPLLAILAAGVISHALSSRFESFYPLRFVAGLSALILYRHQLALLKWRASWRAPAVGVAVFILWVVCAYFLLDRTGTPSKLAMMSPAGRSFWIFCRVAASIVTVPLAEELAYRGYLMRRLRNADFESVPYASVGWAALVISAVVFGLMHGALWFPGILAGLSYGFLLMRSSSMGEAVIAHATTNALLAIAVLGFDQWQFW